MASLDVTALFGEVEVDETYTGGRKSSGKRGRGTLGKTVVVGLKQRKGPVQSHVVADAKRRTIEPIIRKEVCRDQSFTPTSGSRIAGWSGTVSRTRPSITGSGKG